MERKLTTILAADVVGYSALMERDEAGTHERLQARRKELFEPEIARHHGRIFKLMGDGMLAEFGSVVNAVECAVSLQRGLAERNAEVPEDQRIQVRIGINLGEVIVEGDDRYGEGVNIAARLEQLADSGGICVSGKVAKEIGKKLAFAFEPMGEHKVKNIVEPIAVYRVRFDGAPAPRGIFALAASSSRKWPVVSATVLIALMAAGAAAYWFRPGAISTAPIVKTETTMPDAKPADSQPADTRPSLAVLPFVSMSDDKEQGYVADGISEDLTTELARVPGLFVISRTAAFNYKGKDTQLALIAKELGVRYVLEGSIRRAGAEMRINAQLIDTQTGGHVWAERFDGDWGEVFELQDKVIQRVVGALELRLITSHRMAIVDGGTTNPTAYDAYLKGLEHEYRNTPQEIAKALTYYERAVTLDPDFGTAFAKLAWIYHNASRLLKFLGVSLLQDDINAKLHEYLNAASKHPSPTYYQVHSEFLVTRHREYDEAIAGLEKAIALDPSDPLTYEAMSLALTTSGRAADGLDYLDAAMRVDPGWTNRRHYLAGLAYFCLDRFADAAVSLEKVDLNSADFWTRFNSLALRMAAYGFLGRSTDLSAISTRLRPLVLDLSVNELSGLMVQGYFAFKDQGDTDRLIEGLRKAGVPELPFGLDPTSKNRLTGADLKKLYLGHETVGRLLGTNRSVWSKTEMDGTFATHFGPWESGIGKVWFEGNSVCFAAPKMVRTCATVFRNPLGTHENTNEYLSYQPWDQFEFSVVK